MLNQHASATPLVAGLVGSALALSGLAPVARAAPAPPSRPTYTLVVTHQAEKFDTRIRAKVRPTRVYAHRTSSRLKVRVFARRRQAYGHVQIDYRGFYETARLHNGSLVFHHLGRWPSAGQKRVRVHYVGSKRFKPATTVVKFKVRRRSG